MMVDREELKQRVRLMPAAALLELAERAVARVDTAEGEMALAAACVARASQSVAEAVALIEKLRNRIMEDHDE